MRAALVIAAAGIVLVALAQTPFDRLVLNPDHPAIEWSTAPAQDAVAELNRRLESGAATLEVRGEAGFLAAVLKALDIPASSQMLVFSRTSLQRQLINPQNPRAVYFNDTTAIGYIAGAPVIEVATHDPRQGINFYTLAQDAGKPAFVRQTRACTNCHATQMGEPGMLLQSLPTAADGQPLYQLGYWAATDKTPFENRWGGWFVTGKHAAFAHMGNRYSNSREPGKLAEAAAGREKVDGLGRYLTGDSDIVALMVFEHQMETMNWITRLGWYARILEHEKKPFAELAPAVEALADALLFVGEAPLPTRVASLTTFPADFAARGPKDKRGRSLRDFDLEKRLFRYPLSYLIYSPAFEALPAEAKAAVSARLAKILSGEIGGARYAHLTPAVRQAIREIVADTRAGLLN